MDVDAQDEELANLFIDGVAREGDAACCCEQGWERGCEGYGC